MRRITPGAGATPFYHTGSDAGNVAVAALVGGAASKLGGGSFADGAATAAFGYLFNQAMSRRALASAPGSGGAKIGGWFPRAYDVDFSINPYHLPAGLAAIYYGLQAADGAVYQNSSTPPSLPEDIIGDNPRPSSGNRINTDRPAGAFPGTVEDLTGGHVAPDPQKPEQMCCENGVRIRPGNGSGPRIDIPANGPKPHETIHFPPGTTWPW